MPGSRASGNRRLRRALGFWGLVAFGIGDILGAGIYALVGEIAKVAGNASWLAFGVALIVAGLTALSYAEMGSRFPMSGGEAHFCEQGLGSPKLALLTGWLVLCSGIVSMATVARAFAGYVLEWFSISSPPASAAVAVAFLTAIAVVNLWGIRQTSRLNIVSTIVEASGLLFVLLTGVVFLTGDAGSGASPARPPEVPEGLRETVGAAGWTGVFQAAVLAFFAFIGFEDMVNVAEEVRHPRRNLPLAILVAMAVTGLLYMAVIAVATRVVPPAELGASRAPLLEVVTRTAPGMPPALFTAIALFAVGNTGLLNLVTASRLLYGMSNQKLIPDWFSALHPEYRTPHRATGAILITGIILAASGSLAFLAGTTSILILTVFLSVNASLVAVKTTRRHQVPPHDGFRVPVFFPVVAIISCVVLGAFVPLESLSRGLVLLAIGIILLALQPRSRS